MADEQHVIFGTCGILQRVSDWAAHKKLMSTSTPSQLTDWWRFRLQRASDNESRAPTRAPDLLAAAGRDTLKPPQKPPPLSPRSS
eukprot:6178563-Pleurochrysis_carterae.AAC.5